MRHMAGEPPTSTLLLLHRSLSAQSSSDFHYVRLTAFTKIYGPIQEGDIWRISDNEELIDP